MKKLFLTSAICLLTSYMMFSQAPQAFKYQAIARDAAGNPLASTLIGVRPNIHDGTPTGPVIYQESHTITTNSFGLFNIEIGNGIPTIGTFPAINWGTGNKYIEVEINFGAGYLSMGTSQLLSVPYALAAISSMDNHWIKTGNNLSNNNSGYEIGRASCRERV